MTYIYAKIHLFIITLLANNYYYTNCSLGNRHYELSNHLGNVLGVITDNIYFTPTTTSTKLITTSDYYPFGLDMPGRSFSDTTYRYGFNGKEKDANLGEGTHYDYGFRIYNPRIAKFLSVDPLTKSYPMLTPYQFASNSPLANIDIDGLERYYVADGRYGGKYGTSDEMRIISSDEGTLQNFLKFRQIHKDSETKVPIFEGSVPFHEADGVAQQNVTKRVFSDSKFGELDKVIVENNPDSDKGMSVPASHEMKLTINVGLNRDGEFLLDNYYNFKNLQFHENLHLKGVGADAMNHFEIAIAQTKRNSYKNSTAAFKGYMKEVGLGYLSFQAAGIKEGLGQAKLVGKGKEYLQEGFVQEFIKTYQNNVERYNKAFGENEKAEAFE